MNIQNLVKGTLAKDPDLMKKIVNAFSVPVLESKLYNVEQINDNLNMLINDLFLNMDDKRLLSHEWNNKILTDNPAATGYSSFDHNNLTDNNKFAENEEHLGQIISKIDSTLFGLF